MVRRSGRNAAKPEGFYRESVMTKRAQEAVVPAPAEAPTQSSAKKTGQKKKTKATKQTSATKTGRVQEKKPDPNKSTATKAKADKKKPGHPAVPSNDVLLAAAAEVERKTRTGTQRIANDKPSLEFHMKRPVPLFKPQPEDFEEFEEDHDEDEEDDEKE
ncbi:hypothetical protein DPSP01_005172 [Paraphaeosphaeria sporulosa]